MKRDLVNRMIQLAFLEGEITTHGLYEKSVARKAPGNQATPQQAKRLLERLEAALASRKQVQDIPFTIGTYLRKIRAGQSSRTKEFAAHIGITQRTYQLIEDDKISPLKVPVSSWKRMRQFLNLSVQELSDMIRRTYQLVLYQPSFQTTLARYKHGKGKKSEHLEAAAKELYTRIPLPLSPKEEMKLSELLEAIAE